MPFVQRCTVSYKGCARRIERWTNEDEAMKHEWERERERERILRWKEELRGVRARVQKRSKKLE